MSGWDENAGTPRRPIGDLIDSLGIEATVGSDDLVAGALVLLKVLDADGGTRLSLAHSDGLGWIERAGMLRIAETLETDSVRQPDDDG
ncbi:hypothetical protein ACN24M_24605 [Streptomyces microflavus]|uniref:hypothetical protein n=1 Tax=Streptomyces microflavus TaxID=1919 RepID=UPI003B223262